MESTRIRQLRPFLLSLQLLGVVLICTGVAVPQSQEPSGTPTTAEEDPANSRDRPLISDAHYLNVPVSRLMELLDDPKKRVSPLFHVPESLKPVVGFWMKIYAKYSLYQTLIYDRERHDIVYEILDSRELFSKGLSPIALEITAKSRLRRVLANYKAAMRQLQRNPKARFGTGTPGANLIRLWGRKTPRGWREIEAGLRTQPGQRDRIMQGLASADPFMPAMEAIFRKNGIPLEITRIPLVESSFVLQATSKASAVGVWQFLEKSATGDDLVVDFDNEIDERLSPIKSTAAAAKMFKRNFRILHDWGLAIIAYNHGPKNLVPLRDHYGGKNIAKLLMKTTHTPLGYASRSYYFEFLALLHAEKYRDEIYGIPSRAHAEAISIVKIKKPASVFEIAALYNISIHELKMFNPDIFNPRRKLPTGTRIVLPRKHGESIVIAPQIDPAHRGSAPEGGSSTRGIASDEEFIEYIR